MEKETTATATASEVEVATATTPAGEKVLSGNPKAAPVGVTNNLKTIRYAMGIYKQTELAKLLNSTPQSVGVWERNQTQPSIATAIRICKILGVTVEQFFNLVPLVPTDKDKVE